GGSAGGWQRFYDGADAPFSWEPETTEVLASGTLGLTSGPVRDRQGKRTGTFNSVWRREAGGAWKIVFDKGCPPCECRGGRGARATIPPSLLEAIMNFRIATLVLVVCGAVGARTPIDAQRG